MARKERVRETLTALPTLEYLTGRLEKGWKLTALEWERDTSSGVPQAPEPLTEEIPFGLRVADDCTGLVENPVERQIVIIALDMIVDDRPLSHVAEELTRRGYKTRSGELWTPTALFLLLPRMIEIGPRLFASDEWSTRKQRLQRVV